MTQEFSKMINDGLRHYEQDLWTRRERLDHDQRLIEKVGTISQEEFEAMQPPKPKPTKQGVPPAPPPAVVASTPTVQSTSSVAHSLPSSVPQTTKLVLDEDLLRTPRSPMGERESRTGQNLSRFYGVSKPAKPLDPRSPRKQKTRHSENPPVELPVGWVMDSREHEIPVAVQTTIAPVTATPATPPAIVTAAATPAPTVVPVPAPAPSSSQATAPTKPMLRSISVGG